MKRCVYFNHDGGIDDLVSLFLLLQMKHIDLVGVGVIPADSYLKPAVSASKKIIDRFGHGKKIEVAESTSRGKHPFPKEWRIDPYRLDALPILNEFPPTKAQTSKLPAHRDLINHIHASERPVTLVFTGPLTDLARALTRDPSIQRNIDKLVWMGGSFSEKGNVEDPQSDGTAEWNAYWDPHAVKRVWESELPIELVAVESAIEVPLTEGMRLYWASMRQNIGIDFLGQCYALVPPLTGTTSPYFLWDVLTVAAVGNPDLVTKQKVKSIVRTRGLAQGRTEISPAGRPADVISSLNCKDFVKYVTELARI
ncbi:nucleoside hydrolase [Virgibacillus halophilus]|uniref:nucleoside hydrolase n=1 Tax=Tigheibacillus halophilus TaxID=361280 RepID=UPI003636031D